MIIAWLGTGGLLIAACLVLGAVVAGSPPGLDIAVADALGRGWAGAPGTIASGVDVVLGPTLPWVFSVALLGIAVVGWRRGHRSTTWLAVRCLALMWLCRTVSLLKLAYRRERPRPYPDYSYPSGHVVSVSCVAFAAVVLCLWLWPKAVRWVIIASVVAVLVTMVTRVVLDVHWCTDVLGAAIGVVGLGLVAGVGLRLLPARVASGVASTP